VAVAVPTNIPPIPQPTVAAAPAQVPDLKGRTLRVGTDPTYPPFEYTNKNKEIVGYDVDLLNEVCKLANCKVSMEPTSWDNLLAGLPQGAYDVAASGITITEERAKNMDFSLPYLRYGQVVLVRSDEARINGVDDLKDKTVAVQLGTTNDESATKLVGDKSVKRFDTFDLAVQALINKDADAVLIDQPSALGYMPTNKGKLKIVGKPFTDEALGFAFKKGSAEMKAAFDAALVKLQQNGTLDKLYEKWLVNFVPEP
jgi:polar amino acid transport system substrate-binding protein